MKPGTSVAGRFLIERKLGQGGMGVVCLAMDTTLDQMVALKFLPPQVSFDDEALDIMRRETRKCLQLTHQNIIRIHDFHHPEGSPPFIAMEYIDGLPVNTLKARQPDRLLPWGRVAPIAAQVCAALHYAHEQKIVHRDLKPANIMVDSEGRVKLGDFGISASISDSLSQLTRDMGTSGTPAYMSPQQLLGGGAQIGDDIYSLGATLFELLTSKPPFYTGDVSFQIREVPAVSVADRLEEFGLVNAVPSHVTAAISACLEKDAATRPASIAELSRRLHLETGLWKAMPTGSGIGISTGETEPGWDDPTVETQPSMSGATPDKRSWLPRTALAAVALAVTLVAFWPGEPTGGERAEPPIGTLPAPYVSLLNADFLSSATVIEVLRDLNIPYAASNRQDRLLALEVTPWSGARKTTSVSNGILHINLEPTTGRTQKETCLFFSGVQATNFEIGLSYDLGREYDSNAKDEKVRCCLFSRAHTNRLERLASGHHAFDGMASGLDENFSAYLYGHVGGEHRDGSIRLSQYRRSVVVKPFQDGMLSGDEFTASRAIVAELRDSDIVRSGGGWMLIQAAGSRCRIIYSDGLVAYSDLNDLRLDPVALEARVTNARQLAGRGGAIGLSLSLADNVDALAARFGGFHFRSWDGGEPPRLSPPDELQRVEPGSEAVATPMLSAHARELGFRSLLAAGDQTAARVFRVARDGHGSESGSGRTVGSLRSVNVDNWNAKDPLWHIQDGVLKVSLNPAPDATEVEFGFILEGIESRDHEFGFAFRLNRRNNEYKEVQIWTRAATNFSPEMYWEHAVEGFALVPWYRQNPAFHASSPAGRFGLLTPVARTVSAPHTVLADEEHTGFREMVAELKKTRLARTGGRWMALRLFGENYEFTSEDERLLKGKLSRLPAAPDPEIDWQLLVSRIANASGSVAVTIRMNDFSGPLEAEFEGFYFRNLD